MIHVKLYEHSPIPAPHTKLNFPALTSNSAIFFSGGLAGLSMMFYKSSTIALYLASKMSEVRWKIIDVL